MPWTAEQARRMAPIGGQALARVRAEARKAALAGPKPIGAEEYVVQQLIRTRKQIDLLNDILEDASTDWKARKAAADAKGRLYEIEAALANRPKPGQRRPPPEREPRVVQVDIAPRLPDGSAPQSPPAPH